MNCDTAKRAGREPKEQGIYRSCELSDIDAEIPATRHVCGGIVIEYGCKETCFLVKLSAGSS